MIVKSFTRTYVQCIDGLCYPSYDPTFYNQLADLYNMLLYVYHTARYGKN